MIRKIFVAMRLLVFMLITLFSIVIGIFTWDWVASCGACLQEQDYKFMEKVKSKLKNTGDTVKVEDIHQGEWLKVCAASGGYDDNLAWEA